MDSWSLYIMIDV